MARIYPFPIDLSKSLDGLCPEGDFLFDPPAESFTSAFDFHHLGSKDAFYLARREDASLLADRLDLHVFEFSFIPGKSKAFGFYGFSVASGERDLRDRFSVFLVMTS